MRLVLQHFILYCKSKCLENLSPFLCNLLFSSLQNCINDPVLARLQFESSASTVYFDMKITIKNCQPFKKSIVSSSFSYIVCVCFSFLFFFYLKYYLFVWILFLGEMPKSFDLTLMNDKNDNSLFSLSIFWYSGTCILFRGDSHAQQVIGINIAYV